MALLILGLILWTAAHLLGVMAPARRADLDARFGKGPARGLMAVVILLSVALMVIGYQRAEFIEVWQPPAFLTHLNNLLMLVAIFLFVAGRFPSVVRRKIRHPQLTAAKTWAFAHLAVNGDLASIVLFGGILAWAVLSVIATNRRDGARGNLPEATGQGLVVHIAVALIVFSVVAWVHIWVGVWPFAG